MRVLVNDNGCCVQGCENYTACAWCHVITVMPHFVSNDGREATAMPKRSVKSREKNYFLRHKRAWPRPNLAFPCLGR